ncbi:M15 family metallopeptidase [Bordetella bronchiseptica]|uniref:Phage-related protein n=3 Tax=Bordetella bronchiseptica TaxID=518 RepID=A0A0H3LQH1_BORBR|nr:M15 family metallopeptidase [Bordetella bronchiseptica]KAK59350.1 serine-type D-Ala-D-Ala carboxypeptidase [Bordetella bronchiseptica 980-2]SHR39335.1 Uncharacterised protein [Mycobacteroides abscessus subsp. abscessus]AMG89304.1 hypothetical protein AL472_17315 [Bordetella bronchiseptica]AWP77586.1 hypothetical protein B7P10_10495 [Bordetella bronchiseptica]AWP82436.1 hypothetical protein B7P04_10235 [Bordetella bronchiseptica]
MGFQLSARDRQRLAGVYPDLAAVVEAAAGAYNGRFTVLEGARSAQRQSRLLAQGVSQTLRSLHIPQPDGWAHAVDLAPLVEGTIPWEDWASFKRLAEVMKESAARLEIPLEWGGDWTTLKDGPHFQLPRGWRGKA